MRCEDCGVVECDNCGAHYYGSSEHSCAERIRESRLAQLGARCLEVLKSEVGEYALDRYGGPSAAKVAAIWESARTLGLVQDD